MMLGIRNKLLDQEDKGVRRKQDQEELVKYAIIVVDPKRAIFNRARTYNP